MKTEVFVKQEMAHNARKKGHIKITSKHYRMTVQLTQCALAWFWLTAELQRSE